MHNIYAKQIVRQVVLSEVLTQIDQRNINLAKLFLRSKTVRPMSAVYVVLWRERVR